MVESFKRSLKYKGGARMVRAFLGTRAGALRKQRPFANYAVRYRAYVDSGFRIRDPIKAPEE